MATGIAMLAAGMLLGRLTKKQNSNTIDNSSRTAQAVTASPPDSRLQITGPPQIEMTDNAAYGIAPVKAHGHEDEAEREESSMYCEVNNLP